MKLENRSMRLLLVDDDGELLETLVEHLLDCFPSAKIDTYTDGEAALVALEKQRYDVICTDYKMPKISGVELVNSIREKAGSLNHDTPVIFISAFPADVKKEVHRSENLFYITKPFNLDNLVLYVDSAMLSAHINLIDLNHQLINSHNQILQNQSKLIQSAKLTSLGDMSAGIAHELNNPLTAIEGYASLLLKETDSASLQDKVQKIIAAVERMKKVIAHLRVFSRQNPYGEWKSCSINSCVNDALIMIEEQLKIEEVVCERLLEPKLPFIFGDANLIEGMFLNLIMNSREAFQRLGKDPRQRKIKISTMLIDDATIEVAFEDNAGGISPEIEAHIFEPFFSTKSETQGFGLGLSSVYGTVKQHLGQIEVFARHGQGLKFVMQFPVSELPSSTAKVQEPSYALKELPSMAKVLIVDDEADILDILSSYLEDAFIVQTETDPKRACDLLAQNNYDLVVSDLKMPRVSGIEVAKTAAKFSPKTPVVIMSAHLMSLQDIGIDSKTDNIHFLVKPFGSPESVVLFLKEVLAKK